MSRGEAPGMVLVTMGGEVSESGARTTLYALKGKDWTNAHSRSGVIIDMLDIAARHRKLGNRGRVLLRGTTELPGRSWPVWADIR